MRSTAGIVLILLALTGCGGGKEASPAVEQPTATTEAPVAGTPPPATESPAPPSVNLQGNAATNPACALLSIDEVAAAADLDVIGMLGLPADTTNPAKLSESCTWFLDPKVVQSSLVVQYTVYAKRPSDVIAYYPQVVAQGFGKAVPDLGAVSKINGHVVDTIFKRAEIHLTLLTHAEATPEDQAAAIGLMRVVMKGIKQ